MRKAVKKEVGALCEALLVELCEMLNEYLESDPTPTIYSFQCLHAIAGSALPYGGFFICLRMQRLWNNATSTAFCGS